MSLNSIKQWLNDNICERGQHCSCWFDGTWGECCAKHDKRYASKRLTKYQADILLFRCVRKTSNTFMAILMFMGVTILGHGRYRDAQLKKD